MKLIFIMLLIAAEPLFAQTIEQKTPVVSGGALTPIADGTVLGNTSGSTATPSALSDISSVGSISTNGTALRSLAKRASDNLNVRDFGALCNEVYKTDGSTTASTATLISASTTFTSADIGKTLYVALAGNSFTPYKAIPVGWINSGTVPGSGGTGVVPGDQITLASGTVVLVKTTSVQSATVAAGGTGGSNGTSRQVQGTTGRGGNFVALVTISGGAITAVTGFTAIGAYTTNPTTISAEPVVGAGLVGATLNVVMGANTVTLVSNTVKTSLPSNPDAQSSTTGSGTGSSFTVTWGGPFVTTISSVVSAHVAGLTAAPSQTLSGATWMYGTDDTAAINATASSARSALNTLTVGDGSTTIVMNFPKGAQCLVGSNSAGGLNFTGLAAANLTISGNGAVIDSENTGTNSTIIDTIGSAGFSITDLTLANRADFQSYFGWVHGRNSVNNGAGKILTSHFNIDGYFLYAAEYNGASEVDTQYKARFTNRSFAPTSRVLIDDTGNFQGITSAFTTTIPSCAGLTVLTCTNIASFAQGRYDSAEFRHLGNEPVYRLMGGNLFTYSHTFSQNYWRTDNSWVAETFQTSGISKFVFDVHSEASNISDFLMVDNVGPAENITLQSIDIQDGDTFYQTAVIDGLGTTYTIVVDDVTMRFGLSVYGFKIAGPNAAAGGGGAARILMTGQMYWPTASYPLDFSNLNTFSGNAVVTDTTVVIPSGAAGCMQIVRRISVRSTCVEAQYIPLAGTGTLGNNISMSGAVTGSPVSIGPNADSLDANVGLNLTTIGSGALTLNGAAVNTLTSVSASTILSNNTAGSAVPSANTNLALKTGTMTHPTTGSAVFNNSIFTTDTVVGSTTIPAGGALINMTTSGAGSITGNGHAIGLEVQNFDNLAASEGLAIGIESTTQNLNGGTLTSVFGMDSQLGANNGPVTTWISYEAQAGNVNTSTIGTYESFVCDSATLTGATTKLCLYNGDVNAGILSLGYVSASSYKTSADAGANSNLTYGWGAGGTQTGTQNTELGYNSGSNLSTGAGNTFVGYLAGQVETTGSFNTYVGDSAGAPQGLVSSNTCIGYQTCNATVSSLGGSNAVLGATAGKGLTSGYYNTLVGYGAGQSITSGFQNVFIGPRAGIATITTGQSNIVIGYNKTTLAAATNNEINIGGAIIGYATAPTINAGFGTTPTAPTQASTFGFSLIVGSAPGSTGVLTMPAAPNAWNCQANNQTSNATLTISQTANTTTSVSFTSYSRTTGVATAFNASDVLMFDCRAM